MKAIFGFFLLGTGLYGWIFSLFKHNFDFDLTVLLFAAFFGIGLYLVIDDVIDGRIGKR